MIKVEDAISNLQNQIMRFEKGTEPYLALQMAIEALQERKTGKWVLTNPLQDDDGGAYVCSCCKSGSWEVIPKTWKACPWCTALMEIDE